VVHKQGPDLTHELRSFLRMKLPDYMVPSAFVCLDILPLTPNGKVDYRALPDPPRQSAQGSNEYIAARDDTERALCHIWSVVLGVDRVGLDDDFFAIGGHSLLAAKLFARLDESFGRSLPLGVLFIAPTVRLLAEHYRTTRESKARSILVPLCATGSRPAIFGVPGVFGNVIGFAELARALGSEQPFYGLQSVGLDGAEAPFDSIEKMATVYLGEIRSIQTRGPYALIGACFGATVAYEIARQLLISGEEVAFLGLFDPARREGYEAKENPAPVPRVVRRATALGSFFTRRLRLYRNEMRGLDIKDRFEFALHKIRSLSFKIGDTKGFRSVRREIHQLEVIRANLRALDGFRRKPLNGRLRAVDIFETSHPRNSTAWSFDWKTLWDGYPVRHHLPGTDSGDMLSGSNVKILATLLAKRLSESLGETSASPVARQANHASDSERT